MRRVAFTRSGGFTLLEVLMALAILGLALVVLLEAHHTALRLNQEMGEEVLMRQLSESTVARAEVAVLSGTFSDSGDFGNRYPGYSWSFDSFQASDDEFVLLYSVDVLVNGPSEDRSLTFYVYDLGASDMDADTSKRGSSQSRQSGTSNRANESGRASGANRSNQNNRGSGSSLFNQQRGRGGMLDDF